ncbi:metal-dependent hydrolase [Arthrobacter agilis]|jgi:alanyl-tRNA synthetase|uniref:metal-dependent hydrolase n=1 Tax=Arthrobacter agilis TaxID=37921 RepID=UPI002782BEA2|nr:metal-dependent hydrolase [Arthrobacter agilis]MDQ0735660.1 Ser-tRNA(Ala) deacylase AlaX [Arthrobacter agilis]
MALPTTDTRVTYPQGAVDSVSRVLHVETRDDGRHAVLLDTTAFHPVDSAWPDQGPDRGELRADGAAWPVTDCVVGATDGTTLYLGAESPVRKGTEGWAFVVAHLTDADAPAVGDDVVVRVDAAYRAAVSAGHTGCHLASLALNRALADRWKKDVPADALGAPNFDALAVDTTAIGEFGSVDTYRLGKSLRRKGFSVEDLDPAAIAAAVNATLATWTATGAPIGIAADGPGLTDRRRWVCELPGERAEIPCGGTHLDSLAGLAVSVQLEASDADGTPVLVMRTRAEPSGD